MRACEIVWNAQDAARVQELVQAVSGGDCPCFTGTDCPVIPPETISSLRQEMGSRRDFPRAGSSRQFVSLSSVP